MTERQLQFRVGLFVLLAAAGAGVMVFQFGEFRSFWNPTYAVAVHFDRATGVHSSTPVRMNGIRIGTVRKVVFDEEQQGVLVVVDVRDKYRLREDARPRLVRSLLGDAAIEFTPGRSKQRLQPGARLEGESPVDPMRVVNRLEGRLDETLASFEATSREWRSVGHNMNELMTTNGDRINTVLRQSAVALEEFTKTMQQANRTLSAADEVLNDPKHRKNLQQTLAALPKLVEETHRTVAAVRTAVESMDTSLNSLNKAARPFAERSRLMAGRLENTLMHLETVSAELGRFSQLLRNEDGSLQKFVSDPELYRNLNRSASVLSVLLENTGPVLRDVRIFTDKIARHPELMGVGGALQGSSGLKEPPGEERVRQTSGREPERR